jgi:hypothetical protein
VARITPANVVKVQLALLGGFYHEPMTYAAYDAREVTGSVLLLDRELMALWKWASDEGRIEAVTVAGKNYAVVKDEDLVQRIREAAADLKEYRYDEEAKAIL